MITAVAAHIFPYKLAHARTRKGADWCDYKHNWYHSLSCHRQVYGNISVFSFSYVQSNSNDTDYNTCRSNCDLKTLTSYQLQ